MTGPWTTAVSAGIVAGTWLAWPLATYHQGTADDVSVYVVEQPFNAGGDLVYQWRGTVSRACPIEIHRSIIDAQGVVTTLVTLSFDAPPFDSLGHRDIERTIEIPKQIAQGPAIYQAVEVPKCSWLQRVMPVSIPYPPVEFTVER